MALSSPERTPDTSAKSVSAPFSSTIKNKRLLFLLFKIRFRCRDGLARLVCKCTFLYHMQLDNGKKLATDCTDLRGSKIQKDLSVFIRAKSVAAFRCSFFSAHCKIARSGCDDLQFSW